MKINRIAPDQDYVNNLFTEITDCYDKMNTIMTFGMHHLWKTKLIKLVSSRKPTICVDIATGTGDISYKLAQIPTVTNVYATDILMPMLQIAKSKKIELLHANNPTFFVSTAIELPLQDNITDAVTAGFSLRNMPNLQKSISEMVRITKPGGIVATLELTPYKNKFAGMFIGFYFRKIVPIIGLLISKNKSAYTYLPQSVDKFITAEELKSVFESCGLEKVSFKKFGLGTIAIHHGIKPL
jgi:demethylmenaquinone methyltransferase / 2-methoxy-6-polyprenyl-1,4-benzoquinol methylase